MAIRGRSCALAVAIWAAYGTSIARGHIVLDWRPQQQVVEVGEVFDLEMYAVWLDGGDFPVSGMDIILSWESDALDLIGIDNTGAHDWLFSGFPDDSENDGLNDTFDDGNALYGAIAAPEDPLITTPEGTLVTTLQMQALSTTPGTMLTVPNQLGNTTTFATSPEVPGGNVYGFSLDPTIIVVPEPATFLSLFGAIAFALVRRR